MADINIDPILTDPLSIQLYGNNYKLTEPVGVVMSSVFPPKLVTGDYSDDDNPFTSVYSIKDLTGGPGMWQYRSRADLNRYWKASKVTSGNAAITTLWPGAITGNILTLSNYDVPLNTTGASAIPRWIWGLGDTIMYVAGDGSVYNSTGARVDALPADVVAPPVVFRFYDTANAAYRNRIIYPEGSTGYSYQDAHGSAATDVTASATNPGMSAVIVWDNRLWALDNSSKLWSSSTGDDGSWVERAILPIDASGTTYYRLVVYDDPTGSSAIWCITHLGCWIYDAVNDVWVTSRFHHQHYSPASTAGNRMAVVFHDSLYVITGNQKVHKLTMSGGILLIEDVHPGDPDGSLATDQVIRAIDADDEYVYIACSNGTGSSDNFETIFMAYTAHGSWTELARQSNLAAAGGNYTFGTISSVVTSTARRVFLGWHNATGNEGNIATYDISTLDMSPIIAGTTTGANVYLELPVFDGFDPAQQKTALNAKVHMAGTVGTGTITVAYRVNGSTSSYTELGDATNTGSENTLYFGTNRGGLAFKSIQIRLEFDGTKPQLIYFAMTYLRIPEILRGFIVNIDCTAPYGNRTQATMINDIWTAISTNTLGTFTYRNTSADANGSERAYLVKVMRPEGLEWTGYDERGVYKLFLVELNDHPSS